MPPPPPPVPEIHEPEPTVDREPKTRRKMAVGDRLKVLILIVVVVLLSAAYKHSKIPIMSFGEAVRDQLRAKWWLVALFFLEILRQIHYLVCERSARTTSSGRNTCGGRGTGAWTRSTRGAAIAWAAPSNG